MRFKVSVYRYYIKDLQVGVSTNQYSFFFLLLICACISEGKFMYLLMIRYLSFLSAGTRPLDPPRPPRLGGPECLLPPWLPSNPQNQVQLQLPVTLGSCLMENYRIQVIAVGGQEKS